MYCVCQLQISLPLNKQKTISMDTEQAAINQPSISSCDIFSKSRLETLEFEMETLLP